MKQISLICLFLFLLNASILHASPLVCRGQCYFPLSTDLVIGNISSDLYRQATEGNPCYLVINPIKFYIKIFLYNKTSVALIPLDRIYDCLKKEEIYHPFTPNNYPKDSCNYQDKFLIFFLPPRMGRAIELGEATCPDFYFKIQHMHAADTSLKSGMIMEAHTSFTLSPDKYIFLKLNAQITT